MIGRILIALVLVLGIAGCGGEISEQNQRQSDHAYDAAYHLWRTQNDTLGAIRQLVWAIQLNPENAEAHFFLGTIQLSRGELAEAESHLKEALRIRGRFPEVQNSLGVLYIMQKKYKEAEEALKKAIDDILYREPWIARDNLARSYMEQGRYKEAVEVLKRAVFDQPLFCLGYFRMGQALYQMGQDDAADQALKSAIDIKQPGCAELQDAYQLLGLIALKKGLTQEADQHLRRCRELAPNTDIGRKCAEETAAMAAPAPIEKKTPDPGATPP